PRIDRSPPCVEGAKPILGATDLPVELRRNVVEPSFAQPALGVGVDLRECIETRDATRRAGSPDPEWTDADERGRTNRFDAFVQRLNELVDVRAAPRIAIGPTLRSSVLPPRLVVGKLNVDPLTNPFATNATRDRSRFAVRVEVIV